MNNQFKQWSNRPANPLQKTKTGTLAGKVFSVKELFNYPGFPATGSSRVTLPALPDSPLIDKLLSQGAIFAGKVHTHELALGLFGWNPLTGQSLNPLDPNRISGGSSSGSAISVATKECDFSIGTDTGGSIRVPAAFCGVIGYKPTTQRISTVGCVPLSKTLDHVGIIARELPLIARVFDLLKDPSYETGHKRSPAKKIGIWNVENWIEPETWQTLNKFAERFRRAGFEIEKFHFRPHPDLYSNIALTEAALIHAKALSEENPKIGEMTLKLLRQGQAVSMAIYEDALTERSRLRSEADALFQEFDYLLAPTVPCVAPKLETSALLLPEGETPLRKALLRLTSPWSLVGLPTVALPLAQDNLFVGAQLIGARGQDEDLLEFTNETNRNS